ncbi:MAG TPA: gamma-glutamyltransferase, partial [Runella sp.]|nr:gamma-glutamyltransferase [Runella sp.]
MKWTKLLPFTFLLIAIWAQTHAQSFNNLPVVTQKPPLHGKHWMAITGKPLAATAGAMIFTKGGNAVDAACGMLAATCTMWDV